MRAAFPCRESQPNSGSTGATPAIHWHLLCHCLAHTEVPQCHAEQAFGTSLIITIFHRKAACKTMWAQLQDTGESAATRLEKQRTHSQSPCFLLLSPDLEIKTKKKKIPECTHVSSISSFIVCRQCCGGLGRADWRVFLPRLLLHIIERKSSKDLLQCSNSIYLAS